MVSIDTIGGQIGLFDLQNGGWIQYKSMKRKYFLSLRIGFDLQNGSLIHYKEKKICLFHLELDSTKVESNIRKHNFFLLGIGFDLHFGRWILLYKIGKFN